MDDIKERNKENLEKQNLYKLYKNGLVKILDKPEDEDEDEDDED